MHIVARLVALLLCLSTVADANDKTSHAFKALCLNFNVARATVTDTDYNGEQQTVAVPHDVLYLYMSSMKSKDYLNQTSALVDDTEAGWKTKKEALESLKDAASNRLYPFIPDSTTKQAVHDALEKIFNESTALANSIEQIKGEIITAAKEVREALSTAAYGGKGLTAVPQTQFGGRSTTCSGNTACTMPGISIAHDMVCVCSGGTDGTGICGNGIGTTTYDETKTSLDAVEIQKLFADIKTACNKQQTANKATPAAIHAALVAFERQLGKEVADGSDVQLKLGNGAAGDCNGVGSATTCVNYGGVATNGSILNINWVSQMEKAANKLAEATSKRAALEAARVEMRQKQTAAWAAAALLN
uniref:Variant surface glycoprotein 1581 n=1 Tax=Trypanosoma brucei TaxID=5691 RepID=M4SVR4_9TRYP|nr:variant surface glycoprotein 1581 [Trypanosoma brucei]